MINIDVIIPGDVSVSVSLPLSRLDSECNDARYENSDASFAQDIAPGETFVSEDVEVFTQPPGNNDEDDSPVTPYSQNIPSNTDHEVPLIDVFPTAQLFQAQKRQVKPGQKVYGNSFKVLNSKNDLLLTESPECFLHPNGDVELTVKQQSLPDVPNVDSDGETVLTPAGVPFIATPAPTIEIKPCRIKVVDPRTIDPAYSSFHPNDFIGMIDAGFFDFWDYGTDPYIERRLGTDPYTLDAATPNPFGNTDRYTLIDGTPPDLNRTRWSTQVVGKEYCVCDWLFDLMIYTPNIKVEGLVSCLDELDPLNAGIFKGFSDWWMTTQEIIRKSIAIDNYEQYYQADHNLGQRDLISGQIDIYMWTPEYYWTTGTSAWTVNDSNDYARKGLTQSLAGMYICRTIKEQDYAQYL